MTHQQQDRGRAAGPHRPSSHRPAWPEVLVGLGALAVVAYGTGPILLTPLGLSPVVHGLALGALSGVAGIVAFLAAMGLRIHTPSAFGVRSTTIR